MAPKNKQKAEDKTKGIAKGSSSKEDKSGGKLKAANAINARHILVLLPIKNASSPEIDHI